MKIHVVPEEYLTNAINGLVGDGMRSRGECPGNLSFWNPGEEYKAYMGERLSVPMEKELFNYVYSYSLNLAKPILGRLGIGGERDAEILFTPSSTVSIVQVVNLLKFGGIRRLCVLAPAYFSVRSCCRAFGLDFEVIPLVHDDAGWHVPMARIREGDFDALWVTSPILGTGELFSDEMVSDLRRLRDDDELFVVFDESLALPGQELARRFPIDDSCLFIYSPHKAISVNARKFSVLVYHKRYFDSVAEWTDVFCGALPRSCIGAIRHYLSDNYHDICVPAYLDFVRRREADFLKTLAAFPWARTMTNGSGHYRMVFTDVRMPSNACILDWIEDMRKRTGRLFYPGTETGFSDVFGLTFRVNLLLDRANIQDGLADILAVLGEKR